ncbi:MAG: thioredoxin [Candidatus Dormiibacterota bacterium]
MPDAVTPVSDAEFDQTVMASSRPVLVDFWATWCAPCRMLAPVIEDLAAEFGDQVVVRTMDVEANPATQGRLGIMSMPTVMIFKDGQPCDRIVGYKASIKRELRARLQELV